MRDDTPRFERNRADIIRSGAQFGELRAIPTDPERDPPIRACFNCWIHGHRFEQCLQERDRFFFNCGRRDTDLAGCPDAKSPIDNSLPREPNDSGRRPLASAGAERKGDIERRRSGRNDTLLCKRCGKKLQWEP